MKKLMGKQRLALVVLISTSLWITNSVKAGTISNDSDGDGLSDSQEIQLGLDPNYPDSDMDGISDYYEVYPNEVRSMSNANSLNNNTFDSETNALSETSVDSDGDGVSNFLERYGYFYLSEDGQFDTPNRVIKSSQWNELKNSEAPPGDKYQANSPFELAMDTLLDKNIAFIDPNNYGYYKITRLPHVKAYISEAFSNAYGSNDQLISGKTNDHGSPANILKQLMILAQFESTDRKIYFTDENNYSTDWDPYGDGAEVSKVNIPLVQAPADHPLVSAYPVISARITSIGTVLMLNKVDEEGGQIERTFQTETENGFEMTHGWEISHTLEVGNMLIFPEVNASVTHSVHGNYTVSNIKRNSQASSWSNNYSQLKEWKANCVAKFIPSIQIENTGTANAYDIKPIFNIYFNSKEPVFSYRPGLFSKDFALFDLAIGAKKDLAIPLEGEAEICLTESQLRYLNGGGSVRIETYLQDAKLAYWNSDAKRIETEGSWNSYMDLADQTSTRLVISTKDSPNHQSYLVHAGKHEHTSLNLTQALDLVFTDIKPCDGTKTLMCSEDGKTKYHERTEIGFMIRGGNDDDVEKLKGEKLDLQAALQLPLAATWQYHFEIPTLDTPKVINSFIELDNKQYSVKVMASDTFGLVRPNDESNLPKTSFCYSEEDCHVMDVFAHNNDNTTLVYEFKLNGDYQFTNSEFVKINNTRNMSTTVDMSDLLASSNPSFVPVQWVEKSLELGVVLNKNKKIVKGDFNGDGIEDFFYDTGSDRGSAALYLSQSNGKFKKKTTSFGNYYLKHYRVLSGDFNGNGVDELLIQTTKENIWDLRDIFKCVDVANDIRCEYVYDPRSPDKGLYLENHFIKIADFNGDGKSDFIVQPKNINSFSENDKTKSEIYLANASGDGGFSTQKISIDTGKNYWNNFLKRARILIGDFDGDQKQDFIRISEGETLGWVMSGTSVVFEEVSYLSVELCTFEDNIAECTSVPSVKELVSNSEILITATFSVGDFNGDGIDDFIWQDKKPSVGPRVGKVNVFLGTGDSDNPFMRQDNPELNIAQNGNALTADKKRLHIADFNGDGADDFIAHSSREGEESELYIATRKGNFVKKQLSDFYLLASSESKLVAGDFNGDKLGDLLEVTNNEATFYHPLPIIEEEKRVRIRPSHSQNAYYYSDRPDICGYLTYIQNPLCLIYDDAVQDENTSAQPIDANSIFTFYRYKTGEIALKNSKGKFCGPGVYNDLEQPYLDCRYNKPNDKVLLWEEWFSEDSGERILKTYSDRTLSGSYTNITTLFHQDDISPLIFEEVD
ncbi:MAG: VCBS repeat-containing protein [Gammaproteobacteria bacterium]|nr:VCBS repeat-containing protein [Gammaproteobacteria bacterium]